MKNITWFLCLMLLVPVLVRCDGDSDGDLGNQGAQSGAVFIDVWFDPATQRYFRLMGPVMPSQTTSNPKHVTYHAKQVIFVYGTGTQHATIPNPAVQSITTPVLFVFEGTFELKAP